MAIENLIEDAYPLSFIQQGMLFNSLYYSGSGVDILQLVFCLKNLDVQTFRNAWNSTMERNAILRTAFRWHGLNNPLQDVYQPRGVSLPFEYQDWRDQTLPAQQEKLNVFLQTDRCKEFNLSTVPLFRLVVFQTSDNEYQFVWTVHHAIIDGDSAVQVMKEVFGYYKAITNRSDLELRINRPYKDYIDWLYAKDWSASELFWKKELDGITNASTRLSCYAKYNASDVTAIAHGKESVRLPRRTTELLESFSQENQLTLNTLLLGAWAITQSLYSHNADVVFGVVRACRKSTFEGADSVVGPFINTIPLRVGVFPKSPLLSFLKGLRRKWVELRQYEHSSLTQIRNWAKIPTEVQLFDSLVTFSHNHPETALTNFGDTLLANVRPQTIRKPSYSLALYGFRETELFLEMSYDTRKFEADTMRQILGQIALLLEQFVAAPTQQLSTLNLLSEKEKHFILNNLNNTSTEYPKVRLIHELFEFQVQSTPNATAVVCGEEQLTYQTLNQRANQLAHYLKELGIGPEKLVGIYLDHSVEMILGILGVIKAGGAYVPIDPAYPKERIEFVLEDAKCQILLTQQRLLSDRPNSNIKSVCIDSNWEYIKQYSDQNLNLEVDPQNLAYVIYTSGSTGKPKGVMVTQANLVHSTVARLIYYPEKIRRFLLLSSIAFDSSTAGIYGSLCSGGELHIVSVEDTKDVMHLCTYIQRERITHSLCVPSLYKALLSCAQRDKLISLRNVVVAGEAWSRDLMLEHFNLLPDTELYNEYGPTEGTVWCTAYKVTTHNTHYSVSIGKPIPNVSIYILDEQINLLPIGISGEMYIGGAGVTRGYLNNTQLTAEKFIPNPFSKDPGARLYRTGDVARLMPDGNLEFLGRIDDQVKIRGFRIELGEVESVLIHHPDVEEAIVAVKEDKSGDKRLIAYVKFRAHRKADIVALRLHMAEKLPIYMIPSRFVILESIPLAPNGKINRKAVLALEADEFEIEGEYVPPHTFVQEALADIWTKVLGVQKIGVNNNFFEIGGHSLLATQLAARIQNIFAIDISLREIFETPTIFSLARIIEEKLIKEIEELSDEDTQY